jgi:hypothetical protein
MDRITVLLSVFILLLVWAFAQAPHTSKASTASEIPSTLALP